MNKLSCQRFVFALVAGLLLVAPDVRASDEPRKLSFDGVLCERRLTLGDIDPSMPSDWTGYTHLVMEMRTSTPQRFALWVYTADGPRRIEIQPFGQNVWLRASVPLQVFQRHGPIRHRSGVYEQPPDQFILDVDLGAVRRADLRRVDRPGDAVSRSTSPRSSFARSTWPNRMKDRNSWKRLRSSMSSASGPTWTIRGRSKTPSSSTKELTDEANALGTGADFGYCELGGYKNTQAKATGFFHVEQIDGKWWFVDPHGHLYLVDGRKRRRSGLRRAADATRRRTGANPAAPSQTRRLEAWGMTTGGQGRPNTVMLRWPPIGRRRSSACPTSMPMTSPPASISRPIRSAPGARMIRWCLAISSATSRRGAIARAKSST